MNLKGMEAELYRAALSGSFEKVNRISDWKEQQTATKSNILHLHVGKPILNEKQMAVDKDRWDPVVYVEFIEKVLDEDEGYLLLKKKNNKGDTPLHVAGRLGHTNAVKMFLERAKRVTHEDVTGLLKVINLRKDTALHEAARAGHADVVELLVGADPSCPHHEPNERGETPLYLAAERGFTPSVLSILDTCDASTLDYGYKGPCGRTPLHAAVQWGEPDMVMRMLEKDRTLMRIQNDEGLTPLHCVAAEISQVEVLQILLQYEKDVKEWQTAYVQDNMGRTPLHIAVLRKNQEAIEHLIDSCPDCIEIVDNKGQNVLHYAAKWTCFDIMYWLLRLEHINNLVNDKDVDGNTPFHLLASSIPHTPILHPCLDFLPHTVEFHPSLDLKAFNKQNLTVGDILLSSDSLLRRERLLDGGQYKVIQRGRRINTYERDIDIEKATTDYRFGEWNDELLKEAAQSRLVVAALIATVSFTAGFAVPGGFNQNPGKNMGMAVLKREPFFMIFLIADAIAFTSSSIALLNYFVLVSTRATWAIQNLSVSALIMNTISVGAMMTAFLAGVSAVLSKSLGLIIPIYVISAAFFCYYYYLIRRTFHIAKYWPRRFHIGNHRVRL